jgi:flagellar basal-body rod protein FlgF
MENTLYVALSRQLATNRQMEVIANNLANANTAGFKGEQMMFSEYLARTPGSGNVSFVQDLALARDLRDGDLTRTGAPLDLAIRGTGWFAVDTRDGERYTRNGHFKLDAERRLVTASGDPVLGAGGPIVFGRDDTDISINEDGTVRAANDERGRIRVVAFANEHELRKAAGNLYRTDAPPQEVDAPHLIQGMIEESNVQPIIQVTGMINAVRSYQNSQRMIESEHDRQRAVIDKLTNEN